MDIFASEDHRQHHALELDGSQLIPSWESPARADAVKTALQAAGHPFHDGGELDRLVVQRVHSSDYLEFLATAWSRWVEDGEKGEAAMAGCWPARRMNHNRRPDSLRSQLGFYSFAVDCSITEGTRAAAEASAALAQAATTSVQRGERAAFALCRPPGHHASVDQFGGYCYLNNAAISAQQLIDGGLARVGIVDIDYHHGNGTQDIFYHRSDVAYFSVHGDPRSEFPYFLGYADETGEGDGQGFNQNEPLPAGTSYGAWSEALDRCLNNASSMGIEALVISVGVDTFEKDPISKFKLKTSDYPKVGERIAAMQLPTVFIFEGGYAVKEVGDNVAAILQGFEEAD